MNRTAEKKEHPVVKNLVRPMVVPIILVAVLALRIPGSSAAPPAGTNDPVAASLDFSDYQELLDEYLRITSDPGAPLETRFDYLKLYRSPGRIQRLRAMHQDLLAVEPAKLEPAARRAWAINTYNYLVLELATANLISGHVSAELKSKGVFGIPIKSVRSMKVNAVGFFELPVAEIGGRTYTLDQFERRFVFDEPEPAAKEAKAPKTSKPRPTPKTLDPRAHFALVCGAVGCPPLQPRAFLPESLDAQLDRATRDALANPRHLSWDPVLQRLAGSSLFTWYEADFGGAAKAFEFALRYAPDSIRTAAAAKPQPGFDRFLFWSWDLNTVPMTPTRAKAAPKVQ